MGTQRKRTTRRLTGGLTALGLVLGLAACDVTLEEDHSIVNISRTCQGEPEHHGSSAHWTQVSVTVNQDETEPYDIDISLNDGEQTASKDDIDPGSGLLLTDNSVNTEEIDVTVAPSDGTGTTDVYHQIFNAC